MFESADPTSIACALVVSVVARKMTMPAIVSRWLVPPVATAKSSCRPAHRLRSRLPAIAGGLGAVPVLLRSGCGVHVHFHQTGSSGVGSLHTKPWSGALLAFDIGFRESRPSTGGTDAKGEGQLRLGE